MSTTLPFKTSYEFEESEKKWLSEWLDKKVFQVNKDLNNGREVFSIALPPPNVTGELHMGHALGGTIQDVLIRYHRMLGYDVHWQIGSDHAGIGTQLVVEKKLKAEEGLRKDDLGREKFIEHVQAWKEKSGNQIIEQMKRLGFSPDYDRSRYTMDAHYQQAVLDAFKRYYEAGYIYKGKRLTNWCPKCLTSLSDLEIEETTNKKKKLYEIKYLLEKPFGALSELIVATTRPETMFGDVAVAINPKDARYADLITLIKGSKEAVKVLIPFINKAIPIILDEQVKLDFGTGVLKVTPAHDFNDNLIAKRHSLPELAIFDSEAKLLDIREVPEAFRGLDRYKARAAVVEALESEAKLVNLKEYEGTDSLHDRCATEIEPALSDQWYLKMKDLAALALKRVTDESLVDAEKTSFLPERYTETFKAWLENIQDWCISRQIWWGHQIPIEGETDVLDTWFSSALWPFISMADDEMVLRKYYPTTVLATAREIINLWVTRMIFSSEFFSKDFSLDSKPVKAFSKVLVHPVVQTPDGKRMSKSKGNAIDPLVLVDKYGADASRMWYAQVGIYSSQDVRFPGKPLPSKTDPKLKDWECEAMEKYKRFANKLYNSAKFTCMNLMEDPSFKRHAKFKARPHKDLIKLTDLTIPDKWILIQLDEVLNNISIAFSNNAAKPYDMGKAQELIYNFIWNHFCDWYIEFSKIQENTETKNQVLFYVLNSSLRALQPFMPFVTEEIWQSLMEVVDISELHDDLVTDEYASKPYIAFAKYPQTNDFFKSYIMRDSMPEYAKITNAMKLSTEVISRIRNIRQSLGIAWTNEISLFAMGLSDYSKEILLEMGSYIKRLAKCQELYLNAAAPNKPISNFVLGLESDEKNIFSVPLAALVDIDKLKTNLEDKLAKLSKNSQQLETRLASMLGKAAEERISELRLDIEKINAEMEILNEELIALN